MGHEHGMVTLDNSLLDHLKDGLVDFDVAMSKSQQPADFKVRAERAGLVEAASG
jgi:Tfp pilus assembly pilus retraction ATPase PilT